MSRDEVWASLTFGPVPEWMRPAFRSSFNGQPVEDERLRDRLPKDLLEGQGGGEWSEDSEGCFFVSLNWTTAGAETFVDCGLLDLLRSLGVPYDCTDDVGGEWDGAEERWRSGMELPFRCRRLDSGDLVMSQFQWASMKRDAGDDAAAIVMAVDDIFGSAIAPIAFGWTGA